MPDTAALGVLIQGLTAWHTLHTAAGLRRDESVVITAAAGGVGSLAIQLAKRRGAGRVIALASTEQKRRAALELGADAAVDSAGPGLTERVIAANGGSRVDVVLESVAGPTFDALLRTLATGGRLVAYGQASGASQPGFGRHAHGPLHRHPRLPPHASFLTIRAATRVVITELLAALCGRRLTVVEGPSFPIASAAEAHRLVGSGETSGKVTLLADEAGWAGRQ